MKYERPSQKTEASKLMEDRPAISRLIIEIDKGLHKKIGIMAREQDRSIKDLVTEVLNNYINQ